MVQQCCSCRHWAEEKGHNRSHASECLHSLPIPHKELSPAQGLGRAAQPSPGTHIHLQTQGVSKPGWLPVTGPHAEKFGEELWGRVNLKSWLKRAPNTSCRTRGPCREIALSSEAGAAAAPCGCCGILLMVPLPCRLQGTEAGGSFALCTAQLGLQLLGEAFSVFWKVLTHVLLFLEGKERRKKIRGKKKSLLPACCLINHSFNFLISQVTPQPYVPVSVPMTGRAFGNCRHRAQRSGTKLKAELHEG